MAEAKTTKVQLHNVGAGPRSFFDAEGNQHILRVGESFDGEILASDKDALSPDLFGEAGDASAPADAEAPDYSQFDFPKLDGLNRDQLLEVATREGLSTMAADADADSIRKAIEASRDSDPMFAAVGDLQKSSRTDLLAIAAKEKVAVETDDNKRDLVVKIAQARVAAK